MFLSNKFFSVKEIKIKDISEKYNYIEISGKITEVSISNSGTTFLKIKDESGSIDALIFKDSVKNLEEIKIGEEIKILGKPQKYKEKLEIVVTSIR